MAHRNEQDHDPRVTKIHSFIVKIWLEETAEEAGKTTWRGHITHVPSHVRSYFSSLDNIALIIAPYLADIGVDLGFFWKIRFWLQQRFYLKE